MSYEVRSGTRRLGSIWREFERFAIRGNLVDLAIGFVIGAEFTKMVNSLVNDIIMPPLGLVIGHVNFSNWYINLSRRHFASFEAAKKAGVPTIKIGSFLNNVITFFIVAIAMFFVVREFNRISAVHKRPVEIPTPPPPIRTCPYCMTDIPETATRCPNCTSHLPKIKIGSVSALDD